MKMLFFVVKKNVFYEYMKTSMLGENNPNYGNKWDEKTKQKVSEIVKTEIY